MFTVDGWFALVWGQDDDHSNVIQIKTAGFFLFFFILLLLPHIIVSSRNSRWPMVVLDYGVWIWGSRVSRKCGFKKDKKGVWMWFYAILFFYLGVFFQDGGKFTNAQLWDKAGGWMHSGTERSSVAFIILLQRLHSHSWCLRNARPASLFSHSVALPSLPSANLSIGVDVLQCTVSTLLTPSRPTVTQISIYWMLNVSRSRAALLSATVPQFARKSKHSKSRASMRASYLSFTSDLFYSLNVHLHLHCINLFQNFKLLARFPQ